MILKQHSRRRLNRYANIFYNSICNLHLDYITQITIAGRKKYPALFLFISCLIIAGYFFIFGIAANGSGRQDKSKILKTSYLPYNSGLLLTSVFIYPNNTAIVKENTALYNRL